MKRIYIYSTPKSEEKALIKIGEAIDVEKRIKEQLNTASATHSDDLKYTLLYETDAIKDDGSVFSDHDIHKILENKGYPRQRLYDGENVVKHSTEWFKIDSEKVGFLIEQFKKGVEPEIIDIDRYRSFSMRPEQQAAVDQSMVYFASKGQVYPIDMLWNAKMRFGKTFTAYQLALAMQWQKVIVVTYKPAVEDAWKKDLESHQSFKDYVFLSGDSLRKIDSFIQQEKKVIAFASFQDLLGDGKDGGIKEKHFELFNEEWDAIIIDEFHYGAGTKKAKELIAEDLMSETGKEISEKELKEAEKTYYSEEDDALHDLESSEKALEAMSKSLTSKYRLFLSGTPFKALANDQFPPESIYNWAYIDEQKAKAEWQPSKLGDVNPYISLPKIQLYLYQVSDELIKFGKEEGKDEFSLNHFFKAKNKKFLCEEGVKKWLDILCGISSSNTSLEEQVYGNEATSPYPYDSRNPLSNQLDHTLWYLSRVDSAYALKALLEAHPVFRDYYIILAAGKGLKSGADAVQPVLDAIDRNKRTITLSVGKLTTGVSIPKWKAVFFLRDVASPENYFQTAFRAQTPHKFKEGNGNVKYKKTCYVFDFSPNRSLKLLTTYSEKLTKDDHKTSSQKKIAEFIRYLPVLKVEGNEMRAMDSREVLTFDLNSVDAKSLGQRFIERRNVMVTTDTINAINSTEDTRARCQDIFDRIKKFKRLIGASDDDMKKSDVDVGNLNINNGKVKELKTKEDQLRKEERKEKDKADKEVKSEREKIRELLRTLLSRLPIYMYLTDATEENLEQIISEDGDFLFRKTTGIHVEDFKYLVDIGLLNVGSIDSYILKFVDLENANYSINNNLIKSH